MADRVTTSGLADPRGPQKDARERKLQKLVIEMLQSQYGGLLDLDDSEILQVPAGYWEEVAAEMAAAMGIQMQEMALDGAEGVIENTPFGLDWGLVNLSAADWAGGYSYEMVSGINTVSQRALQQAISKFSRTPGWTLEDVFNSITPQFGPRRAELIAITEVTRSYGQGTRLAKADLLRQGIRTERQWHTNGDEIVCPLCGGLDGKPESEWDGNDLPAHPKCRCWDGLIWVVSDE